MNGGGSAGALTTHDCELTPLRGPEPVTAASNGFRGVTGRFECLLCSIIVFTASIDEIVAQITHSSKLTALRGSKPVTAASNGFSEVTGRFECLLHTIIVFSGSIDGIIVLTIRNFIL